MLLEIRNANMGNATANAPLPTPQPFVPSHLDIRLNIFWFMSLLSLSLATVLIGILLSSILHVHYDLPIKGLYRHYTEYLLASFVLCD